MSRSINKLSARTVATIKDTGRHSDGGGLYAFVSHDGDTIRRRWIFRFTWKGTTKEMGLGSLADLSLKEAREARDRWRQELNAGRNPMEARDAARKAEKDKATFGECANALIAAKASEWRNEKHQAQWKMTLDVYARPLRGKPVDEVDTEAVLACLQPLWKTKPETASRLRGRIESVLDAARAKGLIPRNEANPARWRGHLDKLLPKRQKLTRGHHAAMAYDDVPAFTGQLRQREAMAALALEFTILTAARSGEVLGAKWDEFDLEGRVWTVPAPRMKAGRAHRVALSVRALAILSHIAKGKTGEFVFAGQKADKPLSGMAMEMVLRRMKIEDVTVHGFRSSFRDWCGEISTFPREVAEAALAHVIGDKAEQAYRRGDALEKRRALMEAWANFCEPGTRENIIAMPRKT
jgi:integrase